MTIRMYDVHFGDCFLLNEENECLLVDFGSIDSKFNFDAVANNISTQIQGKEFSVLLTHFHQDHMNGLWKLTNFPSTDTIKEFYLPSVLCMNRNHKVKYSFLQVSLISDFLQSLVLHKGTPEITMYSLLLSLIEKKTRVRFLERGDIFTCDQTKYEVLWPASEDLKVDSRICVSLDKLLLGERKIGLELDLVNRLIRIIFECYETMSSANFLIYDNQIRELERAYTDIANMYEIIKANLTVEDSKWIKARVKTMRNQANKWSIVFHTKSNHEASHNMLHYLGLEGSLVKFHEDIHTAIANEKVILMTGDATKAVLNKIIKNTRIQPSMPLHQHYSILKAQHHGTKTHFVTKIPAAKQILISNGKCNGGKDKKISHEWAHNPALKSSSIACTDKYFCECSVPSKGFPTCVGCPNTGNSYTDF